MPDNNEKAQQCRIDKLRCYNEGIRFASEVANAKSTLSDLLNKLSTFPSAKDVENMQTTFGLLETEIASIASGLAVASRGYQCITPKTAERIQKLTDDAQRLATETNEEIKSYIAKTPTAKGMAEKELSWRDMFRQRAWMNLNELTTVMFELREPIWQEMKENG